MGLFDLLGRGKSPAAQEKKNERDVARLEKLVATKMSQNVDRQEAISALSAMATQRAAQALLKRFNWSMEPSITDQEEKEAAAQGIVAAGTQALAAIRGYCQKAESLRWPLQVLQEIVPEDEIVDEILSLLDQFDTEYLRNPEPKVQLVSLLEQYPSEDVRVAVEPFLADVNETVRFTAVTTVLAINDPKSVAALVAALEEEESLRVKNRILQGLLKRNWSVPEDLRDSCQAALPPDYILRGDKLEATR